MTTNQPSLSSQCNLLRRQWRHCQDKERSNRPYVGAGAAVGLVGVPVGGAGGGGKRDGGGRVPVLHEHVAARREYLVYGSGSLALAQIYRALLGERNVPAVLVVNF